MVVTAIGCWFGYHVNWIRERHTFLSHHQPSRVYFKPDERQVPWSLWLCGEAAIRELESPLDVLPEASRLFPEAVVREPTKYEFECGGVLE